MIMVDEVDYKKRAVNQFNGRHGLASCRSDRDVAMKAELVPENGDPPIPILRDLTLVGRHEDCDVVIAHPSLSKRHCLLVKTDGLLVIRDLATTNGTKVKGQRVRWAALLPEDRVSFGAYKLRIYLGSDDMPAPSEQRRSRNGAAASRGAAAGAGLRCKAGTPDQRRQSCVSPSPAGPPRILPPRLSRALAGWNRCRRLGNGLR